LVASLFTHKDLNVKAINTRFKANHEEEEEIILFVRRTKIISIQHSRLASVVVE